VTEGPLTSLVGHIVSLEIEFGRVRDRSGECELLRTGLESDARGWSRRVEFASRIVELRGEIEKRD
jgi:hypothetical protein